MRPLRCPVWLQCPIGPYMVSYTPDRARWIKGRPRAVAPGAVILQHDFLGASALAPDGGMSTASGYTLCRGYIRPHHTGPTLSERPPLIVDGATGILCTLPARPVPCWEPLNNNGHPTGDVCRVAFIYHPCPKNHQGGNGIHIMPGCWLGIRRTSLVMAILSDPAFIVKPPNASWPDKILHLSPNGANHHRLMASSCFRR